MPKDEPVQHTQPEEKKPEKSQSEKDQIIREAVSYYLRNDFRAPEIRAVCEEFIAGVDKAARSEQHTASQTHTGEHHNPAAVEKPKPR